VLHRNKARFFSKVSPFSDLGPTEGLAGNSKPIYEVCDSEIEKSAPMYCFKGTPIGYSMDRRIEQPGSINLETKLEKQFKELFSVVKLMLHIFY
jgi:hypothetical protein